MMNIYSHRLVVMSILALLPALARADQVGEALLKKCVQTEAHLTSLQADITVTDKIGAQTKTKHGKVRLKRPNFAHVTLVGTDASDDVLIHSDGRKLVQLQQQTKEFMTEPADGSGANVGRNATQEALVFFSPDSLNAFRAQGTGVKIAGTANIGGVVCKVLQVTGGNRDQTFQIYVGPDNLLHGVRSSIKFNNGTRTLETRLTNFHANTPIPRVTFAFSMPKGAKPFGSSAAKPGEATEMKSGLLAVGTAAPGFSIPLAKGGTVSLAALTKANKVTLVNFWSYFCGPCREELPHLSAMYRQFRAKGFDVVSINSGDDAKTVNRFWAEQKLTHPAALNGELVGEKYHVQAIPTNYLIDSAGRIIARFEGFDEAGIRAALTKAGIK